MATTTADLKIDPQGENSTDNDSADTKNGKFDVEIDNQDIAKTKDENVNNDDDTDADDSESDDNGSDSEMLFDIYNKTNNTQGGGAVETEGNYNDDCNNHKLAETRNVNINTKAITDGDITSRRGVKRTKDGKHSTKTTHK